MTSCFTVFFIYLSQLWRHCWVHWGTAGRGPWGWRWGFGCTSAAAEHTSRPTWSCTQMSGRYPGCLSPWRRSPQPRQTPHTSPRPSLSSSQSPHQTDEARRELGVTGKNKGNKIQRLPPPKKCKNIKLWFCRGLCTGLFLDWAQWLPGCLLTSWWLQVVTAPSQEIVQHINPVKLTTTCRFHATVFAQIKEMKYIMLASEL